MREATSRTLPAGLYRGRGGQLYFHHTFVPVEFLWKFLAEGQDVSAFLAGFPQVTREQVVTALRSAGQTLAETYAPDDYSLR